MACPHLEYRSEGSGQSFDEARAYCTVTGEFVQPMRADVCNDRYALDHERDCEIYRAEHGTEQGERAEHAQQRGEDDHAERGPKRGDGA